MLADVIDVLADPIDGTPLERGDSEWLTLKSESGHSYDVARQGYVTLAGGAGLRYSGDDAKMIAAREDFLSGGHYAPFVEAFTGNVQYVLYDANVAEEANPAILEIGAGTGYYLAHTLDGVDGARGVGIDVSVPAAKHLAKCHPRVGAVVADALALLPIRDNSVDADASLASLGFYPSAPGSYALGVVELERAYVHGPCGVAKLPVDELRPHPGDVDLASREFDARDEVGRLSQEQLRQLLSDALVGFVDGFRCSEFELAPSAALHAGEALGDGVWVSDIDVAGLMLSTIYNTRLTSVFIEFPEEIREFSDLAGAISALAATTSARHASPRI